MASLMMKLSSIEESGASAAKSTMVDNKKTRYFKNKNNRSRDDSNGENGSRKLSQKKNRGIRQKKPQQETSFTKPRRYTPRTFSRFDKFRNTDLDSEQKQSLNQKGMDFASKLESRGLFISRKQQEVSVPVSTEKSRVTQFLSASLVHAVKNLPKPQAIAEAYPSSYTPETLDKTDLTLSKDKIGYSEESRVLKALETLANSKGYKLSDKAARNSVTYLPNHCKSYPFGNTLLPTNLNRPASVLKNLSTAAIGKEEITAAFASIVKGIRPELKFDESKKYKTDQLKLNAQVVANGLNRNAQLQVDNIHASIAPILVGEAKVSSIPRPISVPIKL